MFLLFLIYKYIIYYIIISLFFKISVDLTGKTLIENLNNSYSSWFVTVHPECPTHERQLLWEERVLRLVLPIVVKVRGVTEGMTQAVVGRKLTADIRNPVVLGVHRLSDVDDAPVVTLYGQGVPSGGALWEDGASWKKHPMCWFKNDIYSWLNCLVSWLEVELSEIRWISSLNSKLIFDLNIWYFYH